MRSGYHVPNKINMSGHIYNTNDPLVLHLAGRKAEFDGQSSLLFGSEAIGVAAGKQLDKSCLTVINVAGCAQHDIFARLDHRPALFTASAISCISSS